LISLKIEEQLERSVYPVQVLLPWPGRSSIRPAPRKTTTGSWKRW